MRASLERSALVAAPLALALVACTGNPPATGDAGVARDSGPPIDAGPVPLIDVVGALADPYAPARRPLGRVTLRSSRTPDPQPNMINDDYAHYIREEGGRAVLAEEEGPGVMTRMWFTFGPDYTAGPSFRLHIFVDGAELELAPGESGVSVGTLTSGEAPGLPSPWALDDDRASGGFLVQVPIAYARSLRVELETVPGSWTYYQIDLRDLRGVARVESFAVPPPAAHVAALEEATRIWSMHEHPGTLRTEAARMLAPGESIAIDVAETGVITELGVLATGAARAGLRLVLTDGDTTAVDAPVASLLGSVAPAGPHDSALSSSDASEARLFYPIPLEDGGTLRVQNDGSEPVSVGLELRFEEGTLAPDLGRFRADCGTHLIDVPVSICEQNSPETYPNVVVGAWTGAGWYAGQSFVMHAPDAWWWALENDHEISVDGQYDVLGTGTEDYFGGAFYFRLGPFSSPLVGATGWDPVGRERADLGIHLFRHHLVDGIPFERELRFEYESYVDGTRFDGCSFFYERR